MSDENTGSSASHPARLAALRARMAAEGIDAFIVPHADAFQNEFLPASEERLSWLTGFTGSAGAAVVLQDRAAVFTDGRYLIQVRREVDTACYEICDIARITPPAWAAGALGEEGNKTAGCDPWLHTAAEIGEIEEALEKRGHSLRLLEANPLDAVWSGRPPFASSPVEVFPDAIAGWKVAEKRDRIVKDIRGAGAGAAILTRPDSIAWLLNIRGSDVPHTPLVLSYAAVRADTGQIFWFLDPGRISEEVRRHLGPFVEIAGMETLGETLAGLAGDMSRQGQAVGCDLKHTPEAVRRLLADSGAKLMQLRDPCVLPRACKTVSEQQAMRASHRRDGASLVRFLVWLERQAADGSFSEASIAERLRAIRRTEPLWRSPSFDTICGFNANGAVVHYRAREGQDARIEGSGLLLIDSGAQYVDGTTDVTRTIAVGRPSEEMRRHYTLVLRAHLAVARARFPAGTTGAQIDALARQPLWAYGMDYAHGTGHGVGCYLSVHEEAATISPRGVEPLQPGMVLSNEPGYYREGQYGIRIENLILVRKLAEEDTPGRTWLGFENLTLAPYDRRLIVPGMLTPEERAQVDAYHARVLEALSPLLDDTCRAWLAHVCGKMD